MSDDEDRPAQNGYNDTHRAFLQGVLARGSFTMKQGKKLIAAILSVHEGRTVTPNDVSDADFQHYTSAAGNTLSAFDYELRSALHQESKTRIWAVINATSDPLTQAATTRTPEEMLYVRRLLDGMFEAHNTRRQEVMALDPFQVIHLAKPSREKEKRPASNALFGGNDDDDDDDDDDEADPASEKTTTVVDKGLTSSQAERVLEGLVDEGFFERSLDGWYSLSVRGLIELRAWLIATYNDPDADDDSWQRIKFCVACKEIITTGQRCRDPDCNVRLHDICEAAFWRTRRGGNGDEHKCPQCQTSWDGNHFVGERAVTSRRNPAGRSKSRPSEVRADVGEQDEEEGEGEGEEEE